MFLENLFNGIGDVLGGLFGAGNGSPIQGIKDPAAWWEQFKNGQTNEVNKEIAEENLAYQRERAAIEDERYEEETAYNRQFAENERDYQRAFAEDERDYQREMAADERDYQREMDSYKQAFAEDERDYQRQFAENEREYNRALQQKLFDREDTALERQASSLSKMGINPLSQQLNGLGAGSVVSTPATTSAAAPSIGSSSAGSSSAGRSSAPSASGRGGSALHNDFKMQDMGVLQALAPLASLANSVNTVATGAAQRDLLAAQRDKQLLDNAITAHDYGLSFFGKGKNRSAGNSYTTINGVNYGDHGWLDSEGWKNKFNMNSTKPDWAKNMDYLLSDSFYESAEKALTKGSKLFDKAFNDGIKDESKKHANPFSMFMNLFF